MPDYPSVCDKTCLWTKLHAEVIGVLSTGDLQR